MESISMWDCSWHKHNHVNVKKLSAKQNVAYFKPLKRQSEMQDSRHTIVYIGGN